MNAELQNWIRYPYNAVFFLDYIAGFKKLTFCFSQTAVSKITYIWSWDFIRGISFVKTKGCWRVAYSWRLLEKRCEYLIKWEILINKHSLMFYFSFISSKCGFVNHFSQSDRCQNYLIMYEIIRKVFHHKRKNRANVVLFTRSLTYRVRYGMYC